MSGHICSIGIFLIRFIEVWKFAISVSSTLHWPLKYEVVKGETFAFCLTAFVSHRWVLSCSLAHLPCCSCYHCYYHCYPSLTSNPRCFMFPMWSEDLWLSRTLPNLRRHNRSTEGSTFLNWPATGSQPLQCDDRHCCPLQVIPYKSI